MDPSSIASCLEVTDTHIRHALAPARSLSEPGPRERVLKLVERMTQVAVPQKGAPKILVVLAHMATAEWIEGELVVQLRADEDATTLGLLVDDGLSAERILGPLTLDVPFTEFRTALGSRPEVIVPLQVSGAVEEDRVDLRTTAELRRTSMPPAYSAVSDSLMPRMKPRSELPRIMSRPPPSKSPAPESDAAVSLDEADLESIPPPEDPSKRPPPKASGKAPPLRRPKPPSPARPPSAGAEGGAQGGRPAAPAQPVESRSPSKGGTPPDLPPHLEQALAAIKKKPKS